MLSHKLRASVANTTIPVPTDANFNQVSLLLHGDGTNGAQNNTFLDSSTNNFTITRNGNTTQGTNTPFSQPEGAWSNYFNYVVPNANNLKTPASSNFNPGTGDFTVECWMNANTLSGTCFDFTSYASGIFIRFVPNLQIYIAGTLVYNITFSNTANTWFHFALVRTSGVLKVFKDGVQVGSDVANTTNIAPSGTIMIGASQHLSGAGDGFLGYISNSRYVVGTAVYTTTFTPPTTPLTAISGTQLLTCQSNYFKDNSSNNFTITATAVADRLLVEPFSPFAPTSAYSTSVNGGSMYFNKTTNSLTSPTNTALSPRTGNWTFECWVYLSSVTGYQGIFDYGQYTGGVLLRTNNASLDYYEQGAYLANIASVFTASVWTHIAVSRSSGTLKIFKDGVQIFSVADTNDINPSSPNNYVRIGAQSPTPTFFLGGYISNARYLVGTGLYTANFTPPTAPLTAITNTQLLLSGTNAGIFDNAAKNDLETVGNAQISTSVTKFNTGSILFNRATSDCLNTLATPNLNLYSGDFTVEFWFYAISISPCTLIHQGTNWALNYDATSGGRLYYQAGAVTTTPLITGAGSGVWNHVAIVKYGSATKLYLNGTAASLSTTDVPANDTTTQLQIGKSSGAFNGYIDDLRITKGIARYTANFTPPTAAFPNQ